MGARARIALGAMIAVSICVLVPAAAQAGGSIPNLDWTSVLPPIPTQNNPQPGPVATCRKAKPVCITRQIRRLRETRDKYACDHRAVFATTYLVLTKQLFADARRRSFRRELIDPKYLYTEDAVFANVYMRTLRAYERGDEVAGAWQIALDTAGSSDTVGAQDMLLGINAHVQNDMPFVLASMGLSTPGGKSRKPDHDLANGTLNRAYEDVVAEVERRFDESINATNPPESPVDDVAGLELVRGWREGVWRNAERLLNADNNRERREVAESIEMYAAVAAAPMSVGLAMDYGPTRDAYCAAGPSGP